MRYWTIVYPDFHPTIEDYDIVKWETLSDQEILNYYWDYWSGKMRELGRDSLITHERCIEDWCIVHWASRNYWREMKENFQ